MSCRNDKRAETDPGLLAAYLSDPVALLQDGQYAALDALYAEEEETCANSDAEPGQTEPSALEDGDIPF